MNLLVLLSGIADPKWPLPAQVREDTLLAYRAGHEVLGPFDEAALELALKLRDLQPATRIAAMVLGGDALARKVAGFRMDDVMRVDLAALDAWSPADLVASLLVPLRARGHAADLVASSLAPVRAGAPADLVLVGREFGDLDDGTVPMLLANALRMPLVSLALSVQRTADGFQLVRQAAAGLERVAATPPLLVSVSNDANNRLRQPLLKNVMAAKKMQFPAVALAPVVACATRLVEVEAALAAARSQACRFLDGDPQQVAAQLAEVLLAGGGGR